MSHHDSSHHKRESLADQLRAHTTVSAARCYQCGKCSAGCPLADQMDYPPSQLLRLLQLEDEKVDEKVLRSFTIWLCLTCEMCIARCPQEVDIPKLMDFLRQESRLRRMVNPRAKNIVRFHRAFLDSVWKTGRLFEVGLIADYKMRSWHLLQDVIVAPGMFLKGKLHLIPEMIKERGRMGRIFKRTIKSKEAK